MEINLTLFLIANIIDDIEKTVPKKIISVFIVSNGIDSYGYN